MDVLIGGRALCGFGGTGMYNGVVSFEFQLVERLACTDLHSLSVHLQPIGSCV